MLHEFADQWWIREFHVEFWWTAYRQCLLLYSWGGQQLVNCIDWLHVLIWCPPQVRPGLAAHWVWVQTLGDTMFSSNHHSNLDSMSFTKCANHIKSIQQPYPQSICSSTGKGRKPPRTLTRRLLRKLIFLWLSGRAIARCLLCFLYEELIIWVPSYWPLTVLTYVSLNMRFDALDFEVQRGHDEPEQ